MTVGTASTVIAGPLTVGSERAVVSCAGVMAVSVLTAVAPRAGLSVAMRAVTMTEPEAIVSSMSSGRTLAVPRSWASLRLKTS